MHFLFVLIWPTWPQLAHLRCVPVDLAGTALGDAGDPSTSAAPSVCIPFCLSRAMRRSLFRSKRASSFLSLGDVSSDGTHVQREILPLFLALIFFIIVAWFNIKHTAHCLAFCFVFLGAFHGRLTPHSLPPERVYVSNIDVLLSDFEQCPWRLPRCHNGLGRHA